MAGSQRSAELLDALYEAPFEPKGWVSFVQAVERFLEGGVVVLSMPAPSSSERGVVVAPSLEPAFVDAYLEHHFRADPCLRYASTLAVGELVVHDGRIGGEPLSETAFYRDWMAPQGLAPDRLLGGVIDQDVQRRPSLVTVFGRRSDRPGRAALGALRELMPHLRRALRCHFARARLDSERAALAAALDHLPLSVIVLDRSHHVQLTNRRADGLLARRDGLLLDRDGLHAAQAEADVRLRRVLAEAFDAPSLEAGRVLPLGRLWGRPPLRASIFRVPSSAGSGSPDPRVVMFVSDPEAELELPASAMSRLYELTPAESALVRELANGRSLQEAAERLGITRGTARQRLVHVFEKTKTGRQASLVRLVLTGPESLIAGE